MGKQRKKRTRRAQLVFEFLENVSRDVLDKYLPIIGTYVRGKQGIYALYRKNRLYYVGLASNLIGRLKSHLRDCHADTWDRFSIYLTKGDKHLKELETLAIRISSPTGNRTKGGFARSENLRSKFRKDMYKWMRTEIGGMFPGVVRKRLVKGAAKPVTKRISGYVPLAKYVTEKMKIRLTYKGNAHYATVGNDGFIRCGAGTFKTPSSAAKAVMHRRSANGWYWWKYEIEKGKWAPLGNLRKK